MKQDTSIFTSLDHAAGIDIDDSNNLDIIMNQAGMNFNIEQTPVFDPEGEEIPNKKLLRRTDNGHILGLVGSKYTSVDTRTMLEPFHDLVNLHDAKYESAGVLGGGKKCWVSATLPSSFSVPGRLGDQIQQRIVSLINHDGLGGNAYFSLAHRIVCNNQIRLLTKSAGESQFSMRHTKNWQTQFEKASSGFKQAIDAMVNFEETVKLLSGISMKADEIGIFMKRLYKVDMKKDITRQFARKSEKMTDLFIRGQGNKGENRWDALNAVTELLDHHSTKRYKTPSLARRARENRFVSNNLGGYGDSIKQRALTLLTTTDNTFK